MEVIQAASTERLSRRQTEFFPGKILADELRLDFGKNYCENFLFYFKCNWMGPFFLLYFLSRFRRKRNLLMFSFESFVSQKISYYKFFSFIFFFFLIEFHESRSLIGNKCVRQERNANHGPCRNDEILRSVSCYKCVVTDLNLAQGCVTCSVESLSFYFLS